ncbi:MAG: N-methyltryptophan oxidase [Lysobacteraceae bacterium]|nr:MAG: N-methyltryptophan oxidase [Xanthomonadaceae bacterium]
MDNDQKQYEVAVIGLGAMGAAATYQLANKGIRVLGIDQHDPPHSHGSSHGETRITREAIGEGPQFVPLARRSHLLWRKIEAASGKRLFTQCGGLIIAGSGLDSPLHGQRNFLRSTVDQAIQHNILHRQLAAQTIAEQHPQFAVDDYQCGYYEPGAGFLNPEAAISAQLSLAESVGATVITGSKATWSKVGAGFAISVNGNIFYVDKVVLALGPWLPQAVPYISPRLTVRRQSLFWFALDGTVDYRTNTPIFIWHWGPGENEVFYGFPQIGPKPEIKVASEQTCKSTAPDNVERHIDKDECVHFYARHLASRLRGVSNRCTRATSCLYTCTEDSDFIIDWSPEQADMLIVSACSGHGFKHSAAIGEAVAEMITTGTTPAVLLPFALKT